MAQSCIDRLRSINGASVSVDWPSPLLLFALTMCQQLWNCSHATLNVWLVNMFFWRFKKGWIVFFFKYYRNLRLALTPAAVKRLIAPQRSLGPGKSCCCCLNFRTSLKYRTVAVSPLHPIVHRWARSDNTAHILQQWRWTIIWVRIAIQQHAPSHAQQTSIVSSRFCALLRHAFVHCYVTFA